MKYKIGVTGPHGRLGSTLVDMGCLPIDADITNKIQLADAIRGVRPDVVIHTAAYTDVDGAEDNPEEAFRVNVRGTANVRDQFLGPIIHLSTDYIFDGRSGPYAENHKVEPAPLNWYGRSKMASENMVGQSDVIVRTTLLYGNLLFDDFVQRILQQYKHGVNFTVPDKLFGNPTYVPHLAQGLIEIAEQRLETPLPHVINLAGRESLSRWDFAQKIGQVFGCDLELCRPGPATGKARRPQRGGLIMRNAQGLGISVFSVDQGLAEMKKELDYGNGH
jgi:dTDP-4-dehydrorhamnose reductase